MVNQVEQKKSGIFLAHDKQGVAFRFEWFKATLFSPEFAAAMQQAWPFACDAFTPVEMDFLKAFPEVVGAEPYFKPFEPLFKDGVAAVDWNKATEITQSILKGHFNFDASKLSEQILKMYEHDQALFVMVKDAATDTALGFISFLIRANYPVHTVKIMSFAVDVTHQKRGLGKLLMSSIFKIDGQTQRLFLCTRVTNKSALGAYSSWGFDIDKDPILDHPFNLAHWTFMDYKITKSDVLQKVAERFIS